jgi:predicted SAM-dependent methyltransferase
VLRETYRVLCNGGILRLVVPDLVIYAKRYLEETNQLLAGDSSKFTRKPHDTFIEAICGGYLRRARQGLLHLYMYDYPTLHIMLTEAGFRTVIKSSYREGIDPQLAQYDDRPHDSLHVDAVK